MLGANNSTIYRTLWLGPLCVASAGTERARAQAVVRPDSSPIPYLAVSQFQHDRWTTANGLPNHAINWIARSPDGYLWLGTEGGLVRFDGVRFTAFNRNNTAALKGTDLYPTAPLLVDRQGILWIATTGGFVRYQNGEFTRAADSAQPKPPLIHRMVEDRSGRLWTYGVDVDGRTFEIRGGRFVAPDPQSGLPAHATSLAADPNGDMWVGTVDGGLLRVHDGRVEPALTRDVLPGGVVSLLVGRDSVLWVGTQRGFGRF